MEKGYKKTELGYIPVEWELKKVNDFTDFVGSGVTPKGGQSVYKKEGIPFIRSQNVYPDGLHLDEVVFIDNEQNNKMKRTEFKENDVLLNITGASIGRCTYVPQGFGKGNVNQHVCIIRADNTVNPVYLSMYINSSIVQKQIDALNTGSSREGLNFQQVRGLKVCLMGIKEQQKIADILSTVDLQIDYADKIIEKTKKLKKGLMQRLLTKGIGHKKFKRSEVGEIPAEWKVNKLGELVKIKGGYAFKSSDNAEYGVRWLKIANVSHDKIIWENTSYLPEGYLSKYKEYQLNENDYVIALTRPITQGALKIAKLIEKDVPSLLNQRVGKLNIVNGMNVDIDFIYHIMSSKYFVNEIDKEIAGTDPPNISPTQLENIKIVCPSFAEQKQIANILSLIDIQIEGYQNKKVKLEVLKEGLMQQLLTGRLRVI